MKSLRGADARDDRGNQAIPDKVEVAWGEKVEDDERETARVEARLVASVEIESGAYVGFTENLSESGVFVATQATEKVGGMVHLLIALPDLALLRAVGTVRWVRRSTTDGRAPGMGIRFERFSALDAVRVHEFIQARQSRTSGDARGARLRSA